MMQIVPCWKKTWIDPAHLRYAEFAAPEAHQVLSKIDSQSRERTPPPPRSGGAPAAGGLKQQGTLGPSRNELWETSQCHTGSFHLIGRDSSERCFLLQENHSDEPQVRSWWWRCLEASRRELGIDESVGQS